MRRVTRRLEAVESKRGIPPPRKASSQFVVSGNDKSLSKILEHVGVARYWSSLSPRCSLIVVVIILMPMATSGSECDLS